MDEQVNNALNPLDYKYILFYQNIESFASIGALFFQNFKKLISKDAVITIISVNSTYF